MIHIAGRFKGSLAISLALSLVLCVMAMLAQAQQAQARPLFATITVNTTADELNSDGDCSLREAIQAANTNTAVDACTAGSGADTINLPTGAYTLIITGTGEDANATGDLDATDAAGLTIIGAGANSTIINANSIDRAIHSSSLLTLTNLTVQNGNPGSGDGGGVYASTLTLVSVEVLSNTNTGRGGGAYAYLTAHISGTLFRNNSSGTNYGGGLYSFTGGNVIITNSQFISNTGDGGGLLADGGTVLLSIHNTQFISNTGAGSGGGFDSYSTDTRVTNSLFQGNVANGSGGGLRAFYNLIVTNTQFIGNRASTGGGASQSSLFSPQNTTIVNSLFERNTANSGAALQANGFITILHTTIASPTVAAGAAIYYDGMSGALALITNTLIASHTTGIQRANGAVAEDYNLFSGVTIPYAGAPITKGGNSITGTAAFVNPLTSDYHLTANSCGVDTGVNADVMNDFENESRPQGGTFDVGFDESPYTVSGITGLSAANNSPKATGSAVNFTATISAGTCTAFQWNFGDGTAIASGATVTHTYAAVGSYTVRVTATNSITSVVATTPVTISSAGITVTAYNDFNNFNALSAANVTTFGSGSGVLKNFADGSSTGITLTTTGDTLALLNNGAHPTGGDALAIFGVSGTTANGAGLLDNGSTNPITLTLQGLTDNVFYDLVLYTDRAFTPGTRIVAYTISGADSFSNTSSAGSTISGASNETASMDIMNNAATGRVARFSNIDPGTDGRIVIVISKAGGTNQAVQINALRLQWFSGPTPITGLSATNDSPRPLGLPVNFAATVSGGSNISYTWNFGDGSATKTGAVVTRTYTAVGTYTARVTATNSISTVVATTPVTITSAVNWQIDTAGATVDLSNVSCPTASLCKAVGNNGAILSWNGSTWSGESSGVPTDYINGISCPTSAFCKAVTGSGVILSWNGSTWTQDTTGIVGTLYTVSCASSTFCVAVGANFLTNIYVWNGSTWSDATSGSAENLWGVSCISSAFCKAVGDNGTILSWNGAAWSANTSGTSQQLNAVDCATTTFCKAVGASGTIRTWNGATWSGDTAGTSAILLSVSCPTSTLCKAVGAGGVIRSWDGSVWSAETSNTTQQLLGVDCFNSSLCIAVGGGGTIRRLGSAPVTPPLPPTIGGTPLRTTMAGQLYQFTPTASDPLNRPLTFIVTNKPVWATFYTTTGVLSGTPSAGNVGTYVNISIGVSNGVSTTNLLPFDLTVNPAPAANPLPYEPKSMVFRAALGDDFITQTLRLPVSNTTEAQTAFNGINFITWSTVNAGWLSSSEAVRQVRANKAQFTALGTYTRTITGIYKSQPITIPVTIIVDPPQLRVSRYELRFSGETTGPIASQAVRIQSTSSISPVNWTATSNQAWVTLSTLSGATPYTLTLGVDLTKIPTPGAYTATVTLKDANGLETPIIVIATIVAPGALPIELLALEVTQGVQNWQNDMELVAGRRTFVRAHVRSATGINIANVTAQLTVTQGANAQRLDAQNTGGSITILPSPNPLNTNDSFLFELPSSYLTGTVTVELKGVSHPIACRDANNTANDCKAMVTFSQNLPVMPIKFFLTAFQYNGLTYTSNMNHVSYGQQALQSYLPLSGLTVSTADTVIAYAGDKIASNFLALTRSIYRNDGRPKQHYHSLLSTVGNGHLGGVAYKPGFEGVSSIGLGTFLNIVPHEVGHNLGLGHANCGNPASIDFTLPVTISAGTVATATYYGFDINKLIALAPQTYEVMGYCPPSWSSYETFRRSMASLKTKYNRGLDNGDYYRDLLGQRVLAPAGSDVIYVSGMVTGTQTGVIQSVFGHVSDSPVVSPTIGPFVLRLENASGGVIATYNIAVDGEDEEGHNFFTVALPHKLTSAGSIKKIVLLYGSTVLHTVTASNNEPIVSNGNTQYVSPSQLNVSWTNTDADSNPMNYLLEYNPDGTWRTAALGNVNATNFTVPIDPNLWPGTNAGQLRVAVNDGFYTTWYTVTQSLTVTRKVPVAGIVSAPDRDMAVGDQQVNLRGQGFDRESGQLSGVSLRWWSDRDGLLGTGDSLSVFADALSEGRHTITLEAIDGNGNSSFITDVNSIPSDFSGLLNSFVVDIYRNRPSLPAQLQVTPSMLEMSVAAGQTAAATLPLRNKGDGGALSWTVSANPAPSWLTFSATSGATPNDLQVTVNASSLATGIYTGTLTFQTTGANPQTLTAPYSVQVVGLPQRNVYLPLIVR